jgi:hypothetical protein
MDGNDEKSAISRRLTFKEPEDMEWWNRLDLDVSSALMVELCSFTIQEKTQR